MKKFKYIVVKTYGKNGQELPFMFPFFINHSSMLEGIKTAIVDHHMVSCELVSAGFIDHKTLECDGKSETLNCSSRIDEDTKLFQEYSLKDFAL